MNIVLIGMRGSGKTTIGKILAKRLNRSFIDMDEEIEKKERKTIAKIINKHGWTYFRDIEKKMCAKLSKKDNIVLSTGGGIVLDKQNIINLKQNGILFLIKVDIKTIQQRIKNEKHRPSLMHNKDTVEELEEIWEERKKAYHLAADYIVKNKDHVKCSKEIFEIINQ